MADEIVPDEPTGEGTSTAGNYTFTRSRSLTYGECSSSSQEYVPEPFDSERLPASLASEIQRFLRVANSIESEEPRIAYLCKSFFLFVNFLFSLNLVCSVKFGFRGRIWILEKYKFFFSYFLVHS